MAFYAIWWIGSKLAGNVEQKDVVDGKPLSSMTVGTKFQAYWKYSGPRGRVGYEVELLSCTAFQTKKDANEAALKIYRMLFSFSIFCCIAMILVEIFDENYRKKEILTIFGTWFLKIEDSDIASYFYHFSSSGGFCPRTIPAYATDIQMLIINWKFYIEICF